MPLQPISTIQMLTVPHALSGGPSEAATAAQVGTTTKYAYMFAAPAAGNITDIGFNVAVLTTAGSVAVRVETVDATTGFPSGSLWAANTSATVNISGGAGWYKGTLTAAAAVSRGSIVAVVIEGVTSATEPNYTLFCLTDLTYPTTADIPMNASYATAAWSLIRTTPISLSVEYTGVCYHIPGVWPIKDTNTHTFANNSTPDVYATQFTTVAPIRFCGAWMWGDNDGNFNINLYDSDGVTVLSTILVDSEYFGAVNGGAGQYWAMPEVDLKPRQTYWLGVEPTTTTSTSVYSLDVNDAYHMNQMHGPMTMHLATAKDPSGTGSWSPTTTRRIMIDPQFNAIADSAPYLINGGLVR